MTPPATLPATLLTGIVRVWPFEDGLDAANAAELVEDGTLALRRVDGTSADAGDGWGIEGVFSNTWAPGDPPEGELVYHGGGTQTLPAPVLEDPGDAVSVALRLAPSAKLYARDNQGTLGLFRNNA